MSCIGLYLSCEPKTPVGPPPFPELSLILLFCRDRRIACKICGNFDFRRARGLFHAVFSPGSGKMMLNHSTFSAKPFRLPPPSQMSVSRPPKTQSLTSLPFSKVFRSERWPSALYPPVRKMWCTADLHHVWLFHLNLSGPSLPTIA